MNSRFALLQGVSRTSADLIERRESVADSSVRHQGFSRMLAVCDADSNATCERHLTTTSNAGAGMKFRRPDAIQKMMSEAASHLPDATMAFYSLVTANPEARPALAKKRRYWVEADERQVGLMRKVATTFITPYDREDIYGMFETLDDIVDSLDHIKPTGRRLRDAPAAGGIGD